MCKTTLSLLIILILPLSSFRLFGDIIITNDDMILNGKIIKDAKPDYIDFANYHGTFHIEYGQIKKIIRTESFEADVKIIEETGNPVNMEEVKINYEAGIIKLKEQGIDTEIREEKEKSRDHIIFLSAFYNLNFGKLDSVIKDSMDLSAACDIPLPQFGIVKTAHLNGFRSEIAYFYSKNDASSITGFRASAGPVWQIPVFLADIRFKYAISPLFGIGRYSVNGVYENSDGVKWNICVTTGPFFNISSIIIYPQLKFDYIYDKGAPLYRIGLGIGAGFSF